MKNNEVSAIVFDCETIPDVALIKECFEIDGDKSDLEVTQEAFSIYKEKKGSEFLPLTYHKVVSIAAVALNQYGYFIKVGCFREDANKPNEEILLSKFLQFLDKKKPRLISFNGRGFDLPMLMTRAMKYNLSCMAYFNKSNKWDNYTSRYSEDYHLDLMDSISGFGAVRGLNLNELCKMSGIPGKYDMSGDDVFGLYYENKFDKIDEYCESDVINTYLLFLKYEILKGNLVLEEYKEILSDFKDKIPQNKGYSDIFYKFATDELKGV